MTYRSCTAAEDPDVFFPEPGDELAEWKAKTYCQICPARRACLLGALQRKEEYGIWGGTTPRERAALLDALSERIGR